MYVASQINPHFATEYVIQFHWGPYYSCELQDYYFAFEYVVTNDSACFKIPYLSCN